MSKEVNVTEGEALAAVAKGCQTLIQSQKTLTFSTLSPKGFPKISYTPFLQE